MCIELASETSLVTRNVSEESDLALTSLVAFVFATICLHKCYLQLNEENKAIQSQVRCSRFGFSVIDATKSI